jgi:hypothetical protein
VANRSLHGVLHRHDTVVAGTLFHLTENFSDAWLGHIGNGKTEVACGRQVGEGGLGAEIGHALRGLDGTCGGNDVNEDVVQDVGVQRALVQGGQSPENFAFPGAVNHPVAAVFFQFPDASGQVEPPVDQLQDGVVNTVDLVTDIADIGSHRAIRCVLAV